MADESLNICSFNMHGFTSGAAMLQDLCISHHIVALQEHWLASDGMNKLNIINDQFVVYGVTGMSETLGRGILHGRPFGGVAFMWHKSLSNQIRVIGSDIEGRCVALQLHCGNRCLIIVNVYFPCYSNSIQYKAQLNQCFGFIEHVLGSNVHTDILILGDTNFQCSLDNSGYSSFIKLMETYNLLSCDNFTGGINTYRNVALNQSSCIDHMFVSVPLHNSVTEGKVIESVFNHSDHKPLSFSLRFLLDRSGRNLAVKNSPRQHYLRWDKANLSDYYGVSRDLLSESRLAQSFAQ